MTHAAAEQNSRKKYFVVFIFGYLLWLIAAKSGTGDDSYWHIKVGEWIVAHRAVPDHGIFSYAAADFPWVSHEWLAAVLMYAAFSFAGWPALVFMATLAIGLAMLMLFNFLLKRTSLNTSMIYLLLSYLMLIPHIMPRPHILALPITVFWTIRLIEASDAQKSPPLLLAMFMAFWVNMHGSFIIGLAFIVFFGAEAVFLAPDRETRLQLAKAWLTFLIAGTAACVLTPHGIDGLLLPLKLTSQTYVVDIIAEWASPNFHFFQGLEVWLLLFLALVLSKGLTLPLFRMIFVLGLLHLSLKSIRFSTDLLSFLAPMALAGPFAKQLNTPPDFALASIYPKKLSHWLLLTVYLASMAFYLPFRTIESPQSIQLRKILNALHPERAALGNVLNSYAFSVYLIHEGFPVYIDSRGELYGDKFLKDYFDTIGLAKGPQSLRDKIDKYHITWTLFETKLPVNAILEMMPGWKKIYSDRYATLFLAADREISAKAKRELDAIKKSLPAAEADEDTQERLF